MLRCTATKVERRHRCPKLAARVIMTICEMYLAGTLETARPRRWLARDRAEGEDEGNGEDKGKSKEAFILSPPAGGWTDKGMKGKGKDEVWGASAKDSYLVAFSRWFGRQGPEGQGRKHGQRQGHPASAQHVLVLHEGGGTRHWAKEARQELRL